MKYPVFGSFLSTQIGVELFRVPLRNELQSEFCEMTFQSKLRDLEAQIKVYNES